MKWIDLSHPLQESLPVWPGDGAPYKAEVLSELNGGGHYARRITVNEHYGTHLDAPAHFFEDGKTVDQLEVCRLVGPACVVSIVDKAQADPDAACDLKDLQDWEARFGPIPSRSIVLACSGWDARWPSEDAYLNVLDGRMHFPGFSKAAAELIVRRGAVGIGVDSLSVDRGLSTDFEVHHVCLGAGLFQLENLTGLGTLPPSGAELVVAPLNVVRGSGSPCRVFARIS